MSVGLVPLTHPSEVGAAFAALRAEFIGTYPWFDQWLERTGVEVANGERQLNGIVHEGQLVGVFLVHVVDRTTVKANAMIIWPEFRRRGFSKAAYDTLFQMFESTADYVFTQCKEGNVVARKLIDRVGFLRVGHLNHLIEQSTDNLVFVRPLRPNISWTACVEKAREIYTVPACKAFVPAQRS